MRYKTSTRVSLLLAFLVLISESLEDVDVPLLSTLDAPLKATLDLTKINKQLTNLIDIKVKAGIEKALENLVENKIEKRVKLAQNAITAWNNNILSNVQNRFEGKEK